MTATQELWAALRQQAQLWSETPITSAVRSELPRNALQRTTGVPGVLQELHAGFGSMMAHPIRLGSVVTSIFDQELAVPSLTNSSEKSRKELLKPWIRSAMMLENAHRSTVAWIRSRLPDYPLIRAPQLVPGTPLTTTEWTWRLIWTPNERRQQLQFKSSPPAVLNNLHADAQLAKHLTEAVRWVLSALEQTDEWKAFEKAAKELNAAGKADLRAARERLTKSLTAAAVDSYEPTLAMRRNEYRTSVTADVVNALCGSARVYIDAFANVNDLIDICASEVFGQLAMHGDPTSLPGADLDLKGGIPTKVDFKIPDDYWMLVDCGSVAWLADPLVSDAIRIESTSTSLNVTGAGEITVHATILDNTGDAWNKA